MRIPFGKHCLVITFKVEPNTSELDRGIVACLQRNEFIEAIRFCKEKTGWTLMESKIYCEKFRDKYYNKA